MNFVKFIEHAIPLFVSSNILPLPMLYFKLSSTLMLDVHNKKHNKIKAMGIIDTRSTTRLVIT